MPARTASRPTAHADAPRLARRQRGRPTAETAVTQWRLPALRIEQTPGKVVYCFAVDGRQVPKFASITRIADAGDGQVAGYQRPEVQRHIDEIRAYIDSDTAMIPNAVVLAFDPEGLSFEAADDDSANGTAVITLGPGGHKPGFIVDGQQRLGAIRESSRRAFPVYATAFVTETVDEQREQFVLVNNTKPLPKGLIYELLPSIDAQVPKALQAKKIPAQLTALLDTREGSPFKGLIKRPTNPDGIVQDSSVQNMIAASISDGALRQFASLEGFDFEGALTTLIQYWSAVKATFPDAWGVNPKASRLMHGAGITALGKAMDYLHQRGEPSSLKIHLTRIKPCCAWTSGTWELQGREGTPWNHVQNTAQDKRVLSGFIIEQMKNKASPT